MFVACAPLHLVSVSTSGTDSDAFLPAVPMMSRFDVAFDVERGERDPDDVAIEARVVAPSGRATTIGGFWSHGRFHVRFAPRELGVHRWSVRADAGKGWKEVALGRMRATAPARTPRGFAGIDPAHRHRIVGDDGSTVIVLGENRINIYDPTWNDEKLDTESYIARMASFGMTAVRVFLFADCESETAPGGQQLGCLEPRIGRFDERTADAIDVLYDAAERHGIDVILVAYAVGFTPGSETWRSWLDNPYSEERGGPAPTPIAFFLDPLLRSHAERKLRYIADRWAASPRFLAIDLLNEPEWDGAIGERTWIPWAEAMSRAWRRMDPYRHLVTVGSVGLQWNFDGDERPWYASPSNDLVQWHVYGKEVYDPYALAAEIKRKVRETWPYDKPVLCGEFAYGGEPKPEYEHTHDGIWSLLFSGAGALAHSAPPFEIDSDEPMTPLRAAHFLTLSGLLRSFDPMQALTPRDDVKVTKDAHAWSLATDDLSSRAIWILGPKAKDGLPVAGVEVAFPAPPRGDFSVTWLDDVTGAEVSHSVHASDGKGTTTLIAPPFIRHIAAKLARVPLTRR